MVIILLNMLQSCSIVLTQLVFEHSIGKVCEPWLLATVMIRVSRMGDAGHEVDAPALLL